MRIGVEEPVHEELLVEALDEAHRHRVRLDAELGHLLHAVDLEPLHEGHGEDVPRRQLAHDLGEEDVVRVREVRGHLLHHGRLVQVVGLAAEQIDERGVHALDVAHGDEPLVDGDGDAQDAHVHLDDVADARVEDLHGHLAAVLEPGLVHLPERRGGDGLLLDLRVELGRGPAEVVEEGPLELVEGSRRDLVLQRLELLRVHAREEPAHDREDLAELDVDAAQPQDRAQEAPRVHQVDALATPPQPVGQPHHLAARPGSRSQLRRSCESPSWIM
ncbi:MAG: hypothetical protein M5U28_55825 [Sandaracinaceae bacterium]|nr:hypothetical protein [Sandaracinaceae bacterium]